jgi:PAS domain S-box-containing protein
MNMSNNGLNILLLDDDDNLRFTLANILRLKGMVPISCATLEEGLQAAADQEIAVALVDLRLGDSSGMRFVQALHEANYKTECIILTGFASQQAAIDAVNHGAYSFLQKPFDIDQLLLTIRRAAEKREDTLLLQKSEERYRQISGLVTDIAYSFIIAPDRTLQSEWLVGGFEKITGRSPAIMENFDEWKYLVHPEDVGLVEDRAKRLLDGGVDVTTFRILRPDGEVRWLENYGHLVSATVDGKPRILGACRDITQRKNAEKERDELQRVVASQERLAAVGQLAAGIAHDFDNVLGVITLQAHLVSASQALTQRNQERINQIQQQIQHASHLIQQILDFGRQALLERRMHGLLPTLRKQIDLLRDTLSGNIEIQLEAEEGEYTIFADPTRIQQMIMNLALNAKDAMPDGGTLRFTLSHSDAPDDQMDGQMDGIDKGWVQLRVSDTGTGIAPDIQNRIFEPFFTTKPPGQGAGLGLSQVYGIVAQHDGHIKVNSTPGQGTTFTIDFPLSREKAPLVGRNTHTGQPPRDASVILVVEDDAILRRALLEVIEMLGYRTLSAANGKEALQLLEKSELQPDLILTDLVMPQMGGIEMLNRLAEQGNTTPVVILTGDHLESNSEIFNLHAVQATLTKPTTPEEMAPLFRKVLRTVSQPTPG